MQNHISLKPLSGITHCANASVELTILYGFSTHIFSAHKYPGIYSQRVVCPVGTELSGRDRAVR